MTFAATDSVIIGEKRVSVKKFMVYNMAWLNRNYILPLKGILDEDSQPNRNTQQTQSVRVIGFSFVTKTTRSALSKSLSKRYCS
jgi:hypothetical protein